MIWTYTVHEWIKKMKEKPFPFNIQFYLKESCFSCSVFCVFFASQNLSAIFLSECCASVWSQKMVVLMRNMAFFCYCFYLFTKKIQTLHLVWHDSLLWNCTNHYSINHCTWFSSYLNAQKKRFRWLMPFKARWICIV